jgi:hypothetical protein
LTLEHSFASESTANRNVNTVVQFKQLTALTSGGKRPDPFLVMVGTNLIILLAHKIFEERDCVINGDASFPVKTSKYIYILRRKISMGADKSLDFRISN